MAASIDSTNWSGEGDFTRRLIEALAALDEVVHVRVEDSPASRQDQGYAFLSNELYLGFATETRIVSRRWPFPLTRRQRVDAPRLSIPALAARLADLGDIGEPDYQDEGMLQYLRAERVRAPWQSKGIKVVEMVRIYAAGTQG